MYNINLQTLLKVVSSKLFISRTLGTIHKYNNLRLKPILPE